MQAGSGVARWRAVGRSALRKRRVSRSLGATEVDLRASEPAWPRESKVARMEAERSFCVPRPPARHQATPLPVESFVQRSGIAGCSKPFTRVKARTGMPGLYLVIVIDNRDRGGDTGVIYLIRKPEISNYRLRSTAKRASSSRASRSGLGASTARLAHARSEYSAAVSIAWSKAPVWSRM